MLGFRVRKFPNIKNVEIKTLVILFFFIFLVNTPVNYIKKNALKDIEEKVRISELSLVANFDVLQSYINLSDSLIALDFSNNLLYFNDLMSHMTSEHPFINSVDIYIPINSDRTAEHFWQNTIEVTQFDQVLTVNKPIVNEGKVVGELSISVEIESFMSHFYDGMLIMSERGFVFWSNYEDIESSSQVNFEYIEVLNQIQRVSRPNGTVDLGSYTFVFKKTNEIFGEPAYVVYLIDNSDIVPTYISVTFVLVVLLLIITNFSISENRKKRELEEISYVDQLSELNNRHYLKEIESIIVNGDSHYIGIIDIDYFKKVNDSYGHTVGDKIIKSVASIIKANIRSQDYALRIGGEEFAVIIKSDQISVACEVLERIRLEVERTVNKPKVTVSAGIAPIKRSIEDSINVADQFLYIAKNAGRNQIRSVPNCC